jgi:VWFA-related protein
MILLAVTALAQEPQAPPAAPTFRAGTKLVQVDVVVRDKKGPVAGLTKGDFTVLDDGKPQEIAVFSVKSFSAKPAQRAERTAMPLPPGAVSNRLELGGTPATETIILVDQKNTQRTDQAYAIQRIAKFIEKRHKGDQIGIYSFGKDGMQAVQELTDDEALLSRAVNRVAPQDPNYRSPDTTGMTGRAAVEYELAMIEERVADTKHVLEASARHLAKVPGRKNLIWITAGFPLIIVLQDRVVDFTPDMLEAARALNDANVALYAVDARGLIAGSLPGTDAGPMMKGPGIGQPPIPLNPGGMGPGGLTAAGLDTMNMLAGRTGGKAYYADNGIEDSIQTAVEDAELTYTLGFYPPQGSKDRDVHNLKVKVARGGVSVRYRENYSSDEKLAAVNVRPTMEQLLKDPLDAAQVGLFAETTADPAHPGSYKVRVSVDLHDVKLERQDAKWTGAVDVSFFLEGSKAAQTIPEKISIPAEQLASSLDKPLVVENSIALGGRDGILRIAAQDEATGAAGSIRIHLEKK